MMSSEYMVIDEFSVGNGKVLVLDPSRDVDSYGTSKINVDGKSYPYQLTHNEAWITVFSKESFKGKRITFTA
jgi:hypothetical protein